MNDLKPCPFCGHKFVYADTNCSRLDNMLEVKELQCSIVCRKCGARTAEFNDLVQAIKAWNRRAKL